MNKYQFKTNINCSGCIEEVTPYLNSNNAIKSWKIDTENADKILTVETDNLSSELIEEIVKHAGFSAKSLQGQQ